MAWREKFCLSIHRFFAEKILPIETVCDPVNWAPQMASPVRVLIRYTPNSTPAPSLVSGRPKWFRYRLVYRVTVPIRTASNFSLD